MERRTVLGMTAGAVVTGLAGCAGGSARPDRDHDVGMSTRRFRPAELTVDAGETVVWANTSSHAHTVTAYDEGLPSGADYFASGGYDSEDEAREAWRSGFGGRIDPGDTYEHVFDVSGEYPYVCIPHEASGMTGTVVVES